MAKKKRRQNAGKPAPQAEGSPALSPEEQAARREQQRREWAERKRVTEAKSRTGLYLLIGGGAGSVIVVVALVLLLMSGGGSDGGSAATPTPDPRVGNAEPVATFTIEADDDGQAVNPRFEPSVITARAGEVFEVVIKNVGSVHHNFDISGLDMEYGTNDDWVTPSFAAGEEGSIKVKISEPGSYPFRCDLHPLQQTGTLIIS